MDRLRDLPWGVATAATFGAVGVAYALLALSAYELFGAASIGTTFFPPAGLTFTSFFLLPKRLWPAIAAAIVVAEVAVDLAHGGGFLWSLGWAAANLVEPLVGALAAMAICDIARISRRFFLAFLVGGLVAGPACGASIGATVLSIDDGSSWLSSFADVWIGDALGVLVVAPAILVIARPHQLIVVSARNVDVAIVWAAMVAAGIAFFFADGLPVGYAAIPLLAYPAVRCSSRELAFAAIVVAGALTAATAAGQGPWGMGDEGDAHTRLVQQQVFLLAAIAGAWLLKLEVIERYLAVTRSRTAAVHLRRAREDARHKEDLAQMYRSLSEQAYEQAQLDHQIALTLQNALMPGAVATLDSFRAAGCYLPATETLEVGGDWYEVICDETGRMATIVIGDVVGHSLAAAAAMGQLAAAARALACARHSPASLIENLDLVAHRTPGAMMTTLTCASLDTATGRLTYSCAGHPPPCLRGPDGTVTFLEGARSTPLAVTDHHDRSEETLDLPAGSLLVFYTDGLVERRDHSIDDRIAKLGQVVEGLATDDISDACETLVSEMIDDGGHDDDVALLLVAIDRSADAFSTPSGRSGLESVT